MTFRTKIWIALSVVGVAPLLVLGWLSYTTNRNQMADIVGRLQTQNALELAQRCERFVGNAVAHLRLAVSYIPFSALSQEELGAVLAIPYRQLPYVNVVAILDSAGNAVVAPLYEPDPAAHPELAGHEAVDEADLEAFSGRIPLQAALAASSAVGPPYRLGERPGRVAVAVRIDGAPVRVLAAELSLGELQQRVEELAAAGQAAYLVDASGLVLAHGRPREALSSAEKALVQDGLASGAPLVRTVVRQSGEWLAAFVPVSHLGWGIVVAQPAAEAFAATERVRTLTVLWAALALVLALGLGALLARGLSRPIRTLSDVARAATAGVYKRASSIETSDELGQFGRAFNHMMEEIKRRDSEIRSWNQELQQRVDERTTELRAAQDQILRTRRLAALGSLGAGVAHELNNPLTAIIGLVTATKRDLGADSPQGAMLGMALEQATRVAKIVNDLRQFASQEHEGPGKRFLATAPIKEALDHISEQLKAHRVELHAALPEPAPELKGDPVQIQQLVAHLLQNALNAMPEGGRLEIGVRAVEGDAVKLWVGDTGKGIPEALRERIFDPFFSTKDQPARLGMGLSICHSIVEAHHGKITVESAPGKGSTFAVLLPAAPPAGHLY